MNYEGGPPEKGPRRFVKPVAIALVVAGVIALIWRFAGDTAGVKRVSAPQVTTVIPLPPPPPPPPPKKPPPEKVKEEVKTPVDKPTVAPKPSQAPKPSDNQPKQMTMNASPQAGAGGIPIGGGDGMGGSGNGGGGFGNTSYNQYAGYLLQRVIENDKRVQEMNGTHYAGALNIWMDPTGRIKRVTMATSTGDPKIDAAIVAAVESSGKLDEAPPADQAYPVVVKLQGRI
ncbi:TonB C-terminal domain-containing protein [Burkholderia sp. Ac-20379]|nr:TonB C-terminal domain-containing protein [Burkholderia sp. Ac-20379]